MSTKTTVRRSAVTLATLLVAGGTVATAAGAASASTAQYQPPRVAVGSVAVANSAYPVQFDQFLALQGYGRNHGNTTYTNFGYAEAGSGVYAPHAGPDTLVVTYQGSTFTHTLNGASLKLAALSNNRLAFSGTGQYGDGSQITWTIKGEINGNRVAAVVAYNGSTYKMVMSGKIAADGSVVGTATGPGQALTWTMPAGSFFSVLHYTAPISSVNLNVRAHTVSFSFTVPARAGLGTGIKVTMTAHDGGWGARHDTFAQGGVREPIVGGAGVTVP